VTAGFFEAAAAVAGGGMVVAALLTRRLNRALALLFAGSLTLAIDIAVLSGFVAGVVVATLYAGALVAMVLVWLALLEEEEAPRDKVYLASVAAAAAAGLLLLSHTWGVAAGGCADLTPTMMDVGCVLLALAAASIGIVRLLGGEVG